MNINKPGIILNIRFNLVHLQITGNWDIHYFNNPYHSGYPKGRFGFYHFFGYDLRNFKNLFKKNNKNKSKK